VTFRASSGVPFRLVKTYSGVTSRGQLPQPLLAQPVERGFGELQRPPAVRGLVLSELVGSSAERMAHCQRAGLEIDVGPAEREQLALTQPGGDRYRVQRAEAIVCCPGNQGARLVGRQRVLLDAIIGRYVLDEGRNVPQHLALLECATKGDAEDRVDVPDGGRGQGTASRRRRLPMPDHPRNVGRLELRERDPANDGNDIAGAGVPVGLDRPSPLGGHHGRLEPFLEVLLDCGPSRDGLDAIVGGRHCGAQLLLHRALRARVHGSPMAVGVVLRFPQPGAPLAHVWGVPVFSCVDLPVGTAIAADWTAFDIYLGNDFRIDVSSEAGSRFDQNITGFRAEEDFGFTAEPPVRTGKVVKILGL
jgi:hypothetical protein